MHIAIKSHVRRPQYELQYNYTFESYLDPRLTFAIRGNDENSTKFLRRLSAIVLRTFMGSALSHQAEKASPKAAPSVRDIVATPSPSKAYPDVWSG